MSCHKCGTKLENYSTIEGGWCPKCCEWIPDDLVRDNEEEEDCQDDMKFYYEYLESSNEVPATRMFKLKGEEDK